MILVETHLLPLNKIESMMQKGFMLRVTSAIFDAIKPIQAFRICR